MKENGVEGLEEREREGERGRRIGLLLCGVGTVHEKAILIVNHSVSMINNFKTKGLPSGGQS